MGPRTVSFREGMGTKVEVVGPTIEAISLWDILVPVM